MVFDNFVSIGRVLYIPKTQKLVTVVNIVDINSALVDDGKLKRCTVNLRDCRMTKISVAIKVGARPGTVKKAWAAAGVEEKWAVTAAAKSIARRARRRNLTDFERFKLMRLKQERARIISTAAAKAK